MSTAWPRSCGLFGYRTVEAAGFRIRQEEVALQDFGNPEQQLRIDTLFLENLIHVRPVAIQLPGEPGNRAFLAVKFVFYQFSNVYHGVKKAELSGVESKGRGSPADCSEKMWHAWLHECGLFRYEPAGKRPVHAPFAATRKPLAGLRG